MRGDEIALRPIHLPLCDLTMESISSVKPKKPLRPPPRLRTKTGCLKCLQRRKKCDEAKPVCGACQRLHIQCAYRDGSDCSSVSPSASQASPPTRTSVASPVESLSTPSPRDTSLWLRLRGLRTE